VAFGVAPAADAAQASAEGAHALLCDEIGNLGRLEALLMATTLLRGGGLTVWSFWQNAAQLQIYGSQANTLLDNAGVVQIFGIRNYRMAQDLANVVGGISADALLKLPKSEQILLVESKLQRCRQLRHYEEGEFLKNLTDKSGTIPNAAAQTLQRSFEGAGLLRRKQGYRHQQFR
jgi:type IV secretory pathway TraG/TraD family ATPase VirD4